jgi:hypothetical protein
MYGPIHVLINSSSGLIVMFCLNCLMADGVTFAIVYELTSYLSVDRCQHLDRTLVHVHQSTRIYTLKVRNINSDIVFPLSDIF